MTFEESEVGRKLRGVTDRLQEGHLYNAVYMVTELQQAILREISKIRHGVQADASWLERRPSPAKEQTP